MLVLCVWVSASTSVFSQTRPSASSRGRAADQPKTYQDSLRWMLKRRDVAPQERLKVLHELGYLLGQAGNSEALRVGDQAVALALKLKEWEQAYQFLFNQVLFSERMGDYVSTLKYAQQGLEFCQSYYPTGTWAFYQLMGVATADTKDFSGGLAYMRKALATQKATKGVTPREKGTLRVNIANTFLSVRQYDSVLFYARRALPYLQQINDERGVGYIHQFQGEVYHKIRPQTAATLDSATFHLRRALAIFRTKEDYASFAASAALTLADQYRLHGKPVESEKMADLALQLANQKNLRQYKADALASLAWAYADQGNAMGAYEYDAQAKNLRDSLFNSEKSEALAQLQVKYDVQQQRQQLTLLQQQNRIAQQQKRVALEQNRVAEAQTQAERARVQLLTQKNHAAEARAQVQRTSLELLAEQNRVAAAQTQTQKARLQLLTQQDEEQEAGRRTLTIWLCVLGLGLLAGGLLYWRLRRQSALLAQANEVNRASAAEKEVLLQEIHHRVKNNLQLVSSLLGWQSSSLPEPALVAVLAGSQARIQSMAMVHEFLYRADNLSQVRLDSYLAELLKSLHESFSTPQRPIQVSAELEAVVMEAKDASAFGLLVNELVTNAYKHAFSEQDGGELHISLAKVNCPDGFKLQVIDNGKGLPATGIEAKPKSLGMNLVKTLVKQLRATITATPHHPTGTCIEVTRA
ncbi:sensor histidine kinase [Hymenobacter sp. YC55]|uniref:sensor histidine kinase n=1 Tax=Hymenobacter sp. YC55 TaxID=3034019 RepID=UPI0023F83140|nr:sensor histidine kinase [Hymenobacter sp. YC55]MDF7813930.1 sensor histidine kinase [Hymenobacter sp. YC55]